MNVLVYTCWNRKKLAALFDNLNNLAYQSDTQLEEVDMTDAVRKCAILTNGCLLLYLISSQLTVIFIVHSSSER